jgi:hypothetical protein
MVTKTHVYDGSWREVKKIHIYDQSVATWRLIKYSYIWDGTAWRQVHTNAFVFNKTFTINQTDYDLVNDMVSNGWNGIDEVEATLVINPGVVVYSTVAGAPGYGLRISPNPPTNPGKVIPAPSTITLTVNGEIVGKGGAGGAGGTTTFSTTPAPPANPGVITAINATATVGSAGSAGSPALTLGFPITLNLPPAGRIKGGGGGGGGGGAAYAYFPSTFPQFIGKFGVLGARTPGGGGGGGAHNAPAPSGAGSPSSGGASEEPGALPGNSGGTNAGAATAPNPTSFVNPSIPGPVAVVGGAGAAGGAAGSAGSTGATSTVGSNPGGVSQTRAGGAGGATGRAVFGWGPVPAPTNIKPSSSVNLPSLVGPYS